MKSLCNLVKRTFRGHDDIFMGKVLFCSNEERPRTPPPLHYRGIYKEDTAVYSLEPELQSIKSSHEQKLAIS